MCLHLGTQTWGAKKEVLGRSHFLLSLGLASFVASVLSDK
jgi:hypothetical protein